MKKKAILLVVLVALILSACAAGPNLAEDLPAEDGKIAGFWQGLWHGIISFITFFISLFNENVSVYEIHNNGGWYDFGFGLGVLLMAGGGSSTTINVRRRY